MAVLPKLHEVVEKIDLNIVMITAESVFSALGFNLGKSWEALYMLKLPKFPWMSIYLTLLEFKGFREIIQAKKLQDPFCMALLFIMDPVN